MDGVVREIKDNTKGIGINLVDKNGVKWIMSQLLYADDTTLVAESEENLQHLVNQFEKACARRKLKVNSNKSKVMVCSTVTNQGVAKIQLNGEILEEVNSFRYLGSMVSRGSGVHVDVKHKIMQGRAVCGALRRVWTNRKFGMDVKKVLYEGIVVPTVLYGGKT